jgi:hypothetical protein
MDTGEKKSDVNADGRLEVFGVGTDGVVRHTWQTQPSGPWNGSWVDF